MEPSPVLTPDLIAATEETVARFVAGTVRRAAPRPEHRVEPEQSRAIAQAATEIGLLAGGDGLGLWSRPDDADALRLTLRALTAIAAERTGVALHLHRLALGDALRLRLGLGRNGPAVPLLDGVASHPDGALARLLAGARVESAEAAVLADDLAPLDTRVIDIAEPWQSLLVPVVDLSGGNAAVAWHELVRPGLTLEVEPDSHGLDDTPAVRVCARGQAGVAAASEDGTVLGWALGLEALASVALGLGALRRALASARRYARDRLQGGAPIVRHAAVQELLGEAAAVEVAAESALAAALTGRLAGQLGLRAALLPALAAAANACLQVLGGAGYMRDYGVEACVRDLNHLRACGGPPAALRRLVILLGEVEP